MIIPDLNLLLYAYNDNYRAHQAAKIWLESLLQGNEAVGFVPTVLMGFMRLSTSARAFEHPMSVSEAAGYIRSWLEQPVAQVLCIDHETVECALALLESIGVGGNLTTDAQIAASALANEAVVHTADADFARFPGLRWMNPITGARSRNAE